jgi:hypothetical protein
MEYEMINKIVNVGNDIFYVSLSDVVDDNLTITIDITGDLKVVSRKLLEVCKNDKFHVQTLCFGATQPMLVWSESANGLVEASKLHLHHLHNLVNSYVGKLREETVASRKTTDYIEVSEDNMRLIVLASRFIL